jgi:hypothetical protein
LTEAAVALLISIGDVIASKMDPQREAVPEAEILSFAKTPSGGQWLTCRF